MKNICILYIGNIRTFYDLENEHLSLLQYYKQKYNVYTFCVFSDTDVNLERINNIISPIMTTHISINDKEFHDIIELNKRHPLYIQNRDYMNSLDNDVIGKQEVPDIVPSQMVQYYALRKGIELINTFENDNNIIFDYFIKIRFDFVLLQKLDPELLENRDQSFSNIISCNNDYIKTLINNSKKYYKITSNEEHMDFLKNLKIDHYASRLYTENPIHLNLCGIYVKNYQTLFNIYWNNLQKKQIDNIIYSVNDWFLMTKRCNMNKLKYIISSYGQNRTPESSTHIFCAEYQMFSFMINNNLLPVSYLDFNIGGLYKKQLDFTNNGLIPNGLFASFGNRNVMRINNRYVFDTSHIPTSIKHFIFYGYYGEHLSINFNVLTKHDVGMILKIENNNQIVFSQFCTLKNGDFNFNTDLNWCGKFLIVYEFQNIEGNELSISDIKYNHDELHMDYVSYFTKGYTYDHAFDLTECDDILKNYAGTYFDNYYPVYQYTLDNENERKYISSQHKRIETSNNINVEKIAYFKWKPYIIYKHLVNLPNNHILFYRDSNIKKYPQYLTSFKSLKKTCSRLIHNTPEKLSLLFERHDLKSIYFQKKVLTNNFDIRRNDIFEFHGLVNAGTVICKKTNWTLNFFKMWVFECENELNINYEQIGDEDIFYKWHTNDQAVLNSIIIKMKQLEQLPPEYPYYLYTNERDLNYDTLVDVRHSRTYGGFNLSVIPLVTKTKIMSNGCVLYRTEEGNLHFVRSNVQSIEWQWLGCEIHTNKAYSVSFDIKFISDVPYCDTIGLKFHNPVKIINEWLKQCKQNEWFSVNYRVENGHRNDLVILIFDHAPPNVEFELRNFILV